MKNKKLLIGFVFLNVELTLCAGNILKKQRFYNTPQKPHNSPRESRPDTPQYAQARPEGAIYCDKHNCTHADHEHFIALMQTTNTLIF